MQQSGGHHISSQTYIGKGIFILHMYTNPNTTSGPVGKFAIADVVNKTFKWVTGIPADITKTTTTNYSPKME
ncbi:hypothetical protein CS542_07020 [Pedobacter sp. IW39]|nr:hypothetical protein CS542_07020 [Pedobacter sp. IW39]